MKRYYIRNNVILALCISIICISVGFILISLEWQKEKKKISSFQVAFTEVEKQPSNNKDTNKATGKIDIIENGQVLDMKFTLESEKDELNYVVTIANQGNMAAEIINIFGSPDYEEEIFQKLIFPVQIKVSDISKKIVPAGETISLNIKVYSVTSSPFTEKKTVHYKLSLLTKSR